MTFVTLKDWITPHSIITPRIIGKLAIYIRP